MRHELRLFAVALQFLTRVPVPAMRRFDPSWLQVCVRYFPVVGAVVGAWAGLVLWLGLLCWPAPVAATVSLAATVWLTGAFHEDGLADTFDALGGAVDRERALAIMKDSRIGSYGAAALVLMLALQAATVAALAIDGTTAVTALVWSHAISRAAPVVVMRWLPYAGDAGHAKAKPLATRVSGPGVVACVAWVVGLTGIALFVVPPWPVLAALLASTAATMVCTRWWRRRLGGFTGDTLGATQQLVHGAALLAWLGASGLHG